LQTLFKPVLKMELLVVPALAPDQLAVADGFDAEFKNRAAI
jgi:hypothetical protein